MKKEDRWVCLSCGNEVSGAVEFCPLCIFRRALHEGTGALFRTSFQCDCTR
jgi:rubrerythrin